MYGPIGYYADCDDAYCPGCFELTFGPDGSGWPGFEGWDEPIAIFPDQESDTPTHCYRCESLIEHALTSDGYDYVSEAVADALRGDSGRRCIVRAWWDAYADGLDVDTLLGAVSDVVEGWPERDAYSPTGGGPTGPQELEAFMKTITFSAACKSGRIDIGAYPTRTPGLVVHGRIRADLTVATRGQWVIAHVGSGWALDRATFPNRTAAVGVANLLGDGIDWTRDADDLKADPQVKLSVVAAYKGALISKPV